MALKNPIFVLEGGDGTGKTTLANEIVRLTGAHYLHLTYAKHLVGHMHDYQMGAMKAAFELSKYFPVVIDRWVPSELVYANVFRKGAVEIGNEAREAMLVHMAAECTFVFCQPADLKEYLVAFHELKTQREEMYDTVAGVHQEYDRFIKHAKTLGLTMYIYDRFKESATGMAMLLLTAHPGSYENKTGETK